MNEFQIAWSPDGLLFDDVQFLLAPPPLASAPRPTSALLDGSAFERRQRREARRAMAAVVRALPPRRVDLDAVRIDRRAA